jgi:type I restriction enzyme S subunit
MKRNAYPKYKESGVEWLGHVPEHWEVKKSRFIFSYRSGGTPSTEEPDFWNGQIPWVSSKDMKAFYIEDTEDHISEQAVEVSATKIIPAKTLLVVMRSGILQHSIPACVINYDMAINQDIKAFLPKIPLSPIYYARFIEGYQGQLLTEWRKEGATVESLDVELIKNLKILSPPLSEQQAITAFLDRETGRIDSLVAKKKRLVELLREKRTAMISRAVTKGLDPSVKMKPSGVEWLGHVPEHWEVNRLKTSAHYVVSNVDKVPNENELPVRLCNYTDVYYNDYITPEMELMETTAAAQEIKKFKLEKEDVVITKDSEEWSDIAVSALVKETAANLVCGYHLAIIHPKPKVLSGQFLHRLFHASEINHQFQVAATGVTRYGLPKSAIGEALIPLPPISEQQAIAAFLDRETGKIDKLIGKVETAIEKLNEYRTALISAAVTGKIDVRDAI